MRTIKVLPLDKIFFLKKINLENNAFSGVVCYARRISEVYKIRPNENDKDKVLYLRYKENEYPHDELDEKILENIKEHFPQASVNTSLLMLDVEQENNKRWLIQYEKRKLSIIIEYISPLSAFRPEKIQKDIEVFYFKSMNERHRKMNTNINIIVENAAEYQKIKTLLNDTFELFTNACAL